ncbi:MAG: NUDIX domain-containing protein [Chloroflexi bacterium]|nr:NUDIX domain-containing protein [Chloroflexota bacterium]
MTARPAARVVLLDEYDRVLLLRWVLPAPRDDRRERVWWITPGGGVNPGESHEDGALRELWEETGISGVPLGPWVWTRKYLFRWRGRAVEQQERYFLARVTDALVTRDNFEEYEKLALTEHRWWSIAELRASAERFIPANLADLVEALIGGDVPAEPFVVGD